MKLYHGTTQDSADAISWSGPLPTRGQITRWIKKRKTEGATLRIDNYEVDGSLMPFQCAHDEDGVLYDWFPAEPVERDELIGDETAGGRQRRRRYRLNKAAKLAGFETIGELAAAIIDGSATVTTR